MTEQNPRSSNRGFASMDQDKQRAIAAKGGRAAHASGNAHEFSPAEARAAGRKGGEAISRDRQHMATIGREGGHVRHANARQQQQQPQAIERTAEDPQRQQG
ncbi:KGG domain-containing protein [Stenotrophomonas maltophilia]|uniref:KGG domain-containing protein n=1 Tax=Stenotrophomonas maltophilia TaxID=40324 RepID=UPI0022520278|nr:KGG domain-containing protein [Stenotrophomonas maltophilia]MCX3876927.1 general stress protein [Stenotrophomonas maltophilia]